MEWELAKNIAYTMLVIIAVAKFTYDKKSKSKSDLKQDYTFSRSFLLEDLKNYELTPFLKEKGYQAVAGTSAIRADEVEYLLTLEGSGRWLMDYVYCIKYLDKKETLKSKKIAFNEKYKKKQARLIRKFIYLLVYAVFAMLAVFPLINMHTSSVTLIELLIQQSVSFLVFITIAAISLLELIKLVKAEELVNKQEKYYFKKHTETSKLIS